MFFILGEKKCFQADNNVPTYLCSSALLQRFGLRNSMLSGLKMTGDLKELYPGQVVSTNISCIKN